MKNEEKSKLQSKSFNGSTNPKTLTRITSLEFALEFIKNQQIHFTPFSYYSDKIEGMTFGQAKSKLGVESSDQSKRLPPEERRELLYSSCWFAGDESLYMWDIYSRNKENAVAIQIDGERLINNILKSGDFCFESEKIKFKPSDFMYGNIKYIDFQNEDEIFKKYSLGQFKDKAFEHENEFRILMRQNNKGKVMTDLNDLKCKLINDSFTHLNVNLILSPYLSEELATIFISDFKNAYKGVKVKISKYHKLFQ